MVEMAMLNIQRAITPKVGKSELRFMCSAYCLIVPYICVKFGENISDGIRVMEWSRISLKISELWSQHQWWKR